MLFVFHFLGLWQKLGPRNIGDDAQGQGYAGTLADAVSPLSNPDLIYAGGHNNGASSGVLKSTDRGKTWVPHCNGLWDTAISSLHIVDEGLAITCWRGRQRASTRLWTAPRRGGRLRVRRASGGRAA